jgi:AraC-like DNA-binding protein
MLQDVFDSGTLPVSQRVEAWLDLTSRVIASSEFSVDDPAGFRASLRAAEMGPVRVSALTYSSMQTRRTPQMIRRSDPDVYLLALNLCGRQSVRQDRREASLGPRDLVVYSDSRPYEAIVDACEHVAANVIVRIPRSALPLPTARVDRLLLAPLSGRSGVGGLLSGFLTQLATDPSPYDPADNHRLGIALQDLLTAWLAHHIDAERQAPTETRQRVQFLQIQSFVVSHLGDPDLSPSTVAAAHHMSLRSLHRLFQRQGATVAAFIRHQRLTRAARDLTDPSLAARPVYAIATGWGFPRPADFTRAFRTEYGMTPIEFRHHGLRANPGIRR